MHIAPILPIASAASKETKVRETNHLASYANPIERSSITAKGHSQYFYSVGSFYRQHRPPRAIGAKETLKQLMQEQYRSSGLSSYEANEFVLRGS